MRLSLENVRLNSRTGISLLEVLVSMFVMLIGLLGIAALLPAGRFDAAAGIQLNRAGETGRAALRQLHITEMLHPMDDGDVYWRQMPNSTNIRYPMVYPPGSANPSVAGFNAAMVTSLRAKILDVLDNSVPVGMKFYPGSFCIDPLPILTAASQGNDTSVGNLFTFPQSNAYYAPTLNAFLSALPAVSPDHYLKLFMMPRVLPGPQVLPTTVATASPTVTSTQLSQALSIADPLCRSNDDIVVNPSKKSDDPATQQFSGANLKRAAEGKYSWLATVNRVDMGDSKSPWNVAVAVFLNRFMPPDITEDGVTSERTVYVPVIYGGAGGGEVVLQATGSTDLNLLKLKRGQWILLCQMGFIPPGTPALAGTLSNWQFIPPRWNWYKVIAADDAIVGPVTGFAERSVTLTGPDLNSSPPSATGPYWFTTAAIVDNVIAVYEKEIRLEVDSDWTSF
jgi:hypothetical protein